MLGGKGLADSSKLALLNANYIAHRLAPYYNIRYKNKNNRVAHELLIDLVEFDKKAGLKVADFAKRLQVCLFVVFTIGMAEVHSLFLGLWFPPSYVLLAHPDLHAHRAHRVRIAA
jgi:glycine cleavage system protein P-like pyridoxal-binding family